MKGFIGDMARFFLVLFILWAVLRGTLLFLAWTGDTTQAARDRVMERFTAEDIDRGKEYSRMGFGAKVASGYFTPIVLLVLVYSGFFLGLYQRISGYTGESFWKANLLFILAYFLIRQILAFPFSFYLGHVVETQMGFSNMTVVDWLVRYAKSLAVSLVISSASTLFILWIFRFFERWWPIVFPLGSSLIVVGLTLLFPYVITPIFYNQTPVPDGPLKAKILEVAEKARIPVEGIYQIDESRYSKHTNAYFTGLFGEKRIVLYDTLIKSHTVDESALIFAHEAGHWLHDHVFKGLTLGVLGAFAGSFLLWYIFPIVQSEPRFGLGPLWSAQNLPSFALFLIVFGLFTAPVESQISQYFERQADASSIELTGLTQAFVEAEKRLARDNRAFLLPHPFVVFWLYSHPPAIERIRMALESAPASSVEQGTGSQATGTQPAGKE